MILRLRHVFRKFGTYQAVRIVLGAVLAIAAPVFLVLWRGPVAWWTGPLVLAALWLGFAYRRSAVQNPGRTKTLVDWLIRVAPIVFFVGTLSPDRLWPLIAVAVALLAFVTSALYWFLSEPGIVNLDRQ